MEDLSLSDDEDDIPDGAPPYMPLEPPIPLSVDAAARMSNDMLWEVKRKEAKEASKRETEEASKQQEIMEKEAKRREKEIRKEEKRKRKEEEKMKRKAEKERVEKEEEERQKKEREEELRKSREEWQRRREKEQQEELRLQREFELRMKRLRDSDRDERNGDSVKRARMGEMNQLSSMMVTKLQRVITENPQLACDIIRAIVSSGYGTSRGDTASGAWMRQMVQREGCYGSSHNYTTQRFGDTFDEYARAVTAFAACAAESDEAVRDATAKLAKVAKSAMMLEIKSLESLFD
jgi:hypothetical protein